MRRLLALMVLLVAILAIWALRSARQEHAGRGRTALPDAIGAPEGEPAKPSEPEPSPAAPKESDLPDSAVRVHGVVTGKAGGLWCAHVVAYWPGRDDVIGNAYTDPEGRYSLAVEATDFDVGVEPAAGTELKAPPRRRMILNPGEDREENFALGPMASVQGKVVNAAGDAAAGVAVCLVRPQDMGRADAHPSSFADHVVARARSGSDGGFRLGGLEPGAYYLTIGDPEWMVARLVPVTTDGPEEVLTVVPALSIDLRIRDIETGEAVEGATVRASAEGRAFFDGRTTEGILSCRVPIDQPVPSWQATFEISAPGFRTWGPTPLVFRVPRDVWLVRVRDRNTMIRVSFTDGQPYRGGLRVNFTARSPVGVPDHVARGPRWSELVFDRVEDGVFRGAMPHGSWALRVLPSSLFRLPRLERTIDVSGGAEAELSFVLPAGGTIALMPSRASGTVYLRPFVEGEDARQRDQAPGTAIEVPAEGARIEGVPPGLYQLGRMRVTYSVDPLKKGEVPVRAMGIEWLREVRVVEGGTEEVTLPD